MVVAAKVRRTGLVERPREEVTAFSTPSVYCGLSWRPVCDELDAGDLEEVFGYDDVF